jgi:hypothetical protein
MQDADWPGHLSPFQRRQWWQWRSPAKQGDFALNRVAVKGKTKQFLWRQSRCWTESPANIGDEQINLPLGLIRAPLRVSS